MTYAELRNVRPIYSNGPALAKCLAKVEDMTKKIEQIYPHDTCPEAVMAIYYDLCKQAWEIRDRMLWSY